MSKKTLLSLPFPLFQHARVKGGSFSRLNESNAGAKCQCGDEGYWELYVSEQLGITLPNNGEFTLNNLLMLAGNGNEDAVILFGQIGEYLGVGINNIINIFNLQQVIIGYRMATSQKSIEESLYERLGQALWYQQSDLKINFSELSTLSASLGVAAFSIENFSSMNIQQ